MNSSDNNKKRALGGELVIPVCAIVFTLYYFITIIDSPWTAQVSAFFIGVILLLLSVMFIIRCVLQVRRGEADYSLSRLFSGADIRSGRLALLAVTIGYIIVIDYLGFTITTFLFLFLGMLVLNQWRNKGVIGVLSASMALGGYLLFILAFDTRFPRGPFEIFMKAMLGDGG